MSIFFPAAAAVRTVPAAPDEVLIALPGDRVILSGTGHLPRAAEWPVDGDRLEVKAVPLPETPVNTVSVLRGTCTSIFFKLFSFAPLTNISSFIPIVGPLF